MSDGAIAISAVHSNLGVNWSNPMALFGFKCDLIFVRLIELTQGCTLSIANSTLLN